MKNFDESALPTGWSGSGELTPIILASASPRRRDLLRDAGMPFTTASADVDERVLPDESPEDYVQRLSRNKAVALTAQHPSSIVLGADTVVVLGDSILGKPGDIDEARMMLARLSGRWHEVLTGVTLRREQPFCEKSWVSRTNVLFRELSPEDIDAYIRLVDPLDKAGAYGIQDHGSMLVRELDGLVSTVIGLPIETVLEALASILYDERHASESATAIRNQ